MNYRRDVLDALIAEIEEQGGALLPDPCMPEPFEYKPPNKPLLDREGNVNYSHTCGCGNETKVVVKYDSDDIVGQKLGLVPVCVVCDNVGAWDRFDDIVRPLDDSYWDFPPMKEDDD